MTLQRRVRALHKANEKIALAVQLIKTNIQITKAAELAFWRFEKALKEINQEVLKQLNEDKYGKD